MISRGDALPHFKVHEVDGAPVSYSTIWQRDHLVLVSVAGTGAESREYVEGLANRRGDFSDADAVLVITRDPIADLNGPAALVADRWGEVQHVAFGRTTGELPSAEELLEWAHYVQQRCPECEGEAR